MLKFIMLNLALMLSYFALAEPIVTGTWHKIESKVLSETRNIGVYLPPSYDTDKDSHYPVIYLLDGDETRLRGLSGLVESLSTNNLGRQIPEFIIIAIPNTNRNRDLTPSAVNFYYKEQVLDEIASVSGGAENFTNFISRELFDYVDTNYRTNSSRTLVGESFGGLLAANVLLTHPDLFNNYLIVDATYLWDDNYLNRTFMNRDKLTSEIKAKIFISLANNDHLGEIGVTNQKWGRQFIENLQTIKSDAFKIQHQYFEDEIHGTVAMLSWYYGLLYLFKSINV